MDEPPPLRELTLRLVAFVAHRPSAAIAQAVRHTGRGAAVLVLAPPSERERVEAMGAHWSNMTAASQRTLAWAARYRHSSGNPRGYELFCLQRWLMLWEAVRPMNLAATAAIAVLDDDIVLYRSAASWLRELSASEPHATAQTTGVMGVAFQLHSPETLRRFSDFLRWLYELPTSKLSREVERYGVARPLAALSARQRHMLAHGLVVAANRSQPGYYKHFSDVQAMAASHPKPRWGASHPKPSPDPHPSRKPSPIRSPRPSQAMDAFCRRSAEGKLGAAGRARCSLTTHERLRVHGAPAYADQPTNCSALYLAAVGAGSVLQFHAMAKASQPTPITHTRSPHPWP